INGTLQDLGQQKVSDIHIDAAAVGHDGLAGVLSDFFSRWQRGVDNLSTDGREVAGRLTDSAKAYRAVEHSTSNHLDGILRRTSGPDPAAR
ncbi:MAG: hypothetical protein ACRDRL_09965, partial [Sciscionella sp.]